MKISVIKQKAKAAMQGNWFSMIFVLLLMILITAALDATAIGSLFSGLVMFGSAAFYLELVKTKNAKVGTFFGGMFKKLFKRWGASLLISLYTCLWTLLFIIPGLVKSYAYAMTPYIMLEKPEMGINDAITKSRQMMKGHKWKLFCLDLSFTGWMLLSIITFGIALVYVWPYYSAARAEFYKEVKKASKPAPKA